MRTAGHRRADNFGFALAGALALHLAILAILLLHLGAPPIGGAVVPITIVSHAPTTDSRRAEAAPVTHTAQTETPIPQAKAPEPQPPPPPSRPHPRVAPTPTPKPLPTPRPSPKARPTPTPKATPRPVSRPTPTRTRPSPPTDNFSLAALAADVSRARRASPPRPAYAARGPTRAETAPQARVDAGQGVSQSDVAGLSQLLNRLWNKSCNLDDTVIVPVTFTVGLDGRLQGRASAGGRETSSNPSVAVAARRAIDAVGQAEPFGAAYRGHAFKVIFDAKKACAND